MRLGRLACISFFEAGGAMASCVWVRRVLGQCWWVSDVRSIFGQILWASDVRSIFDRDWLSFGQASTGFGGFRFLFPSCYGCWLRFVALFLPPSAAFGRAGAIAPNLWVRSNSVEFGGCPAFGLSSVGHGVHSVKLQRVSTSCAFLPTVPVGYICFLFCLSPGDRSTSFDRLVVCYCITQPRYICSY